MNKILNNASLFSSKINRQHLQMIIVIVSLILLTLGAGAPGCDGGGGGVN